MGFCCFSTPLENEQPNDGFGDWPFTEFLLSDLTTATKNFSSDEIISENAEYSSNVVYKGLLSENPGFIAVKRFKNSDWPDHKEFAEDAKAVGELKHKRLVKLLGYCCDENERLLVSEFMPDDTLAKRLFHQKNQAMEWSMRLRVAYHIAEALDYCNSAGFASYNNLSAYSVLFDKDGEAGLSCFGLIKAINYDRSQITRGIVNPKSVTYRFGTILVNLLTGMQIPPSNAPEMINGKYVTELMDPNLKGKFSTEEAAVVLKLASECLQCEARKSLITKELVATLKALQTKTQIPYIQMLELERQHEVGASSCQQQQIPTSEMTKQNEEATESTGDIEKTKSTEMKKKLNVLIVDDDPLNLRIHERIIKTIGGISQTARNGEEAVILHRESGESFDLILMDKEMPERDGVSTTKKLREMKVKSMIVGVTSLADHEEERRAFMEAGLNHCLAKPLTKDKILPLINHLLDT